MESSILSGDNILEILTESGRDRERHKWQDPDVILREMGLQAGNTLVDIGCGRGYFTIPAAKMVGEKGKVYALDSNPSTIENLDGWLKTADLKNVYTRVGAAESAVLCEACADFVFFGIVFHDFRNRSAVLKNARRMLKPEGKLIDLDFKKIEMPFGPPERIKLSENEAQRVLEDAGFKVIRSKEIEPYSYLLIAALKKEC
jgi:ubiquinone/menaquinone biosynthesis C-methylase UbiE